MLGGKAGRCFPSFLRFPSLSFQFIDIPTLRGPPAIRCLLSGQGVPQLGRWVSERITFPSLARDEQKEKKKKSKTGSVIRRRIRPGTSCLKRYDVRTLKSRANRLCNNKTLSTTCSHRARINCRGREEWGGGERWPTSRVRSHGGAKNEKWKSD
ncbi:hypothetical protein BC827DRAFT_123976 [Russula dissimulans]|nr:hypothetical protein BC827DRAFT_123976 [Russula dissimulans]